MELMVEDMPKRMVLNDPPGGPHKDLAAIVRNMVKGLTLRQVANHTGSKISIDTIRRAMDGQRVGPEKLDILARSFGRNPNELRIAAGHGLLPDYPDPRTGESVVAAPGPQSTTQFTPDGHRIEVERRGGITRPLPLDLLRRIDFEIRLLDEKEQA